MPKAGFLHIVLEAWTDVLNVCTLAACWIHDAMFSLVLRFSGSEICDECSLPFVTLPGAKFGTARSFMTSYLFSSIQEVSSQTNQFWITVCCFIPFARQCFLDIPERLRSLSFASKPKVEKVENAYTGCFLIPAMAPPLCHRCRSQGLCGFQPIWLVSKRVDQTVRMQNSDMNPCLTSLIFDPVWAKGHTVYAFTLAGKRQQGKNQQSAWWGCSECSLIATWDVRSRCSSGVWRRACGIMTILIIITSVTI